MSNKEIPLARCGTCGAEIPPDSPAGCCPVCLFGDALGELDGFADSKWDANEVGDEDSPPPLQPVCLGDYELLEAIAHGGMGVVHKARQLRLDRIVAIKLLLGGAYAAEEARQRFRAEARAAARLRHPGIVPVYDVGEHQGQLYFSMELVLDDSGRPAPTLEDRIAHGPLPPERAVGYLVGVVQAVGHAHRQGIIHRDLKPSNILIDANDQPRITDFGLARPVETDARLTLTRQILGTPGYLAPEQIAKKFGPVTIRTDVYALGAILYCLLTGRPPMDGSSSDLEDLQRAAEQDPLPPRQRNPRVPRDLEVICLRCLAKEPSRRYADALAVAEDLDRWQRGEPIRSRPTSLAERLWFRARRKPVVASLSLALGLALVVSVPLIALLQARGRAEAARAGRESVARTLRSVTTAVAGGQVADALHRLAGAMREWPRQPALAERFVHLVDARAFLIPISSNSPASPMPEPSGEETSLGVARSADGTWIARITNAVDIEVSHSASREGSIRLTDAHGSAIRSVSFRLDGTQLISASTDGTVRLWETKTGRRLREWPHGAEVHHAVFHPDGTTVATACQDGTIRLWRTDDADPRPRVLATNLGPVACVRFSPDGALLAAGTDEGQVGLWEGARGQPLVVPRRLGSMRDAPVTDVVCASDPPRLRARIGDSGVVEFRASRPQGLRELRRNDLAAVVGRSGSAAPESLLRRVGLGEVTASRVSVDGRWLAIADRAGVWLYDIGSLTRVAESLPHKDPVRWLVFSPDGQRLATGTVTGQLRVWDVASGQAMTEGFSPLEGVEELGFDETSRVLLIRTDQGTIPWHLAASPDPSPAWLPDLAPLLVGPVGEAEGAATFVSPQRLRKQFTTQLNTQRTGTELDAWVERLLDLPAQTSAARSP